MIGADESVKDGSQEARCGSDPAPPGLPTKGSA